MNNLTSKGLTIAAWLISWLLILWLNFSADLAPYMHFVVIPLLLLSTAIGAGRCLDNETDQAGD